MNQQGKESEWNEATLKIIRLHEIQTAINLLKINPLGRSNGEWNYKHILTMIDNLYGEGYSKYSPREREEVDRLKRLCHEALKYLPPHLLEVEETIGKDKKMYLFNKQNYEMLDGLMEAYISRVRVLNDDHGLTTKNKGTSGLF